MTMTAMKRNIQANSEHLISALVPGPLPRSAPAAVPLPALPVRRLPTDPQPLPVLDMGAWTGPDGCRRGRC
jgi:hypothetical protein